MVRCGGNSVGGGHNCKGREDTLIAGGHNGIGEEIMVTGKDYGRFSEDRR